MTKYFILYLLLTLPCLSQAQSKEVLEKYLTKTLSYQHIKYKSLGKDSQIAIHQIEFDRCTMSYSIFKKTGNKTERFRVRIFLSAISKITMAKNKEGYHVITFTTNGKSIVKESPNGNLVHEKLQFIPLKKSDTKTLDYFKKLKNSCQHNT